MQSPMTAVPIVVIASGGGGIDEMRQHVKDTEVQWGLVHFQVGAGAMTRQKVLFLHVNGEDCPPVKRGRANAYTSEVQNFFRYADGQEQEAFHASLEVTRSTSVTYDHVLDHYPTVFATDDNAEYTVKHKIEGFRKQIKTGVPKSEAAKSPQESVASSPPKEVSAPKEISVPKVEQQILEQKPALLFKTGRDGLNSVAEAFGSWNWCLVAADPKELNLVSGGSDSVDGMRACIEEHPKDVLYGLLRMGFGEGRLRRTKYVFVHANGAELSAVARGRGGAAKYTLHEKLDSIAKTSATLEVNDPSDLSLDNVIGRVMRASIIDEAVLDGDGAVKSNFTVEAFRQALKEEEQTSETPKRRSSGELKPEIKVTQPEVKVPEATEKNNGEKNVEDVLKLMRSGDGILNWALFGLSEEANRKRSSFSGRPSVALSPPSPCTPDAGGALRRRDSDERLSVSPSTPGHRVALRRYGSDGALMPPVPSPPGAPHRTSQLVVPSPVGAVRRNLLHPDAAKIPVPAGGYIAARARARSTEVPATERARSADPEMPLLDEQCEESDDEHSRPRATSEPPSASTEAAAVRSRSSLLEWMWTPCPEAGQPRRRSSVSSSGSGDLLPAGPRPPPLFEGPLLKKSGSWLRGWQLRWCEVSDGWLRWWTSQEHAVSGEAPRGYQKLQGMKVKCVSDSKTQFSLQTESAKDKVYYLDVDVASSTAKAGWQSTEAARQDWVKALEQGMITRRRERPSLQLEIPAK